MILYHSLNASWMVGHSSQLLQSGLFEHFALRGGRGIKTFSRAHWCPSCPLTPAGTGSCPNEPHDESFNT